MDSIIDQYWENGPSVTLYSVFLDNCARDGKKNKYGTELLIICRPPSDETSETSGAIW